MSASLLLNPYMSFPTAGGGVPGSPVHDHDFSDDANLTLSGSEISGAADLGSGSNTLSQATPANRPLNTGSINGVQAASFDGSNDYLSGDNLDSAFANTDQPFTLAVVLDLDTVAGFHTFLAINSHDSSAPFCQFATNTSWFVEKRDTSSAIDSASGGTASTGAHVLIFWSDGTDLNLDVDGSSVISGGTLNVGTMSDGAGSANRFSVGAWHQVATVLNYADGDLGRVVLYDSALSSGDRASLLSALQTQFNFP